MSLVRSQPVAKASYESEKPFFMSKCLYYMDLAKPFVFTFYWLINPFYIIKNIKQSCFKLKFTSGEYSKKDRTRYYYINSMLYAILGV